MIPVQSIVTRLVDLLIDYDRGDEDARWADDELIRWINDSRIAIINRSPSSLAKTATITLVAGTLQSIPDDGTELFDLSRNIKIDGAPGRAIRRTDRQELDDINPDWHAGAQKSEVIHFTYDDRSPMTFYVFPPVKDGTKVEIVYPAIPPEVTALEDDLDVGLELLEAIANYVAYRSKSKDSQYANAAEASAFYGAFTDALGGKAQARNVNSPNQPGNSV